MKQGLVRRRECSSQLPLRIPAIAGFLAFIATAQAIVTEIPGPAEREGTPYQSIVERNVFGLKPPPPPPDPNDLPKTPPPKITLTGITTIFGNKRALLKVPPQPGKAGDPGKAEQSSILKEGERDGELEVVHIDVDAKKVEVSYNGQPVTVTFDKDAIKNASGQPAVAIPQGGGIPAPAGMPSHMANPVGNPGFGNPNIPTRPVRGFQPQGASTMSSPGIPSYPGYSAGGVTPGVSVGGAAMPGFQFGSPTASSTQPQQVQPQINPDEQAILIEAQREVAKQKGDPTALLFPPTALNPTANTVPSGPQVQTPTTTTPQVPGLPFAPGVRTPQMPPPLPQMPQ